MKLFLIVPNNIHRESTQLFTHIPKRGELRQVSSECDSLSVDIPLSNTQWLPCKIKQTSIFWAFALFQTQFQTHYIYWCIWSPNKSTNRSYYLVQFMMKNWLTENESKVAGLGLNMGSLALSLQRPSHRVCDSSQDSLFPQQASGLVRK